jgi:hypothetical protein
VGVKQLPQTEFPGEDFTYELRLAYRVGDEERPDLVIVLNLEGKFRFDREAVKQAFMQIVTDIEGDHGGELIVEEIQREEYVRLAGPFWYEVWMQLREPGVIAGAIDGVALAGALATARKGLQKLWDKLKPHVGPTYELAQEAELLASRGNLPNEVGEAIRARMDYLARRFVVHYVHRLHELPGPGVCDYTNCSCSGDVGRGRVEFYEQCQALEIDPASIELTHAESLMNFSGHVTVSDVDGSVYLVEAKVRDGGGELVAIRRL